MWGRSVVLGGRGFEFRDAFPGLLHEVVDGGKVFLGDLAAHGLGLVDLLAEGLDIGGGTRVLGGTGDVAEWVVTRARFTIKFHPGPDGGVERLHVHAGSLAHGSGR